MVLVIFAHFLPIFRGVPGGSTANCTFCIVPPLAFSALLGSGPGLRLISGPQPVSPNPSVFFSSAISTAARSLLQTRLTPNPNVDDGLLHC